jgi:phage FluMu protein gp41
VGTDGKLEGPLSSTIIDDLSGANLTTLNASNISSGTLAAARLPAKVTVTSSDADALDVTGGLTIGSGDVALVGTDGKLSGPLSTTIIDDLSGANLTTLNASNLSSGTVATARLGSGTASSATFLRGDSSWAAASSDPALGIAEGRLTATSNTPVTSADVSGATSIYYTPYIGDKIELYDGSSWNIRTFTQITISLSGFTAIKAYDVFAYDNSGTVTIETLIWTNNTTRATALAYQNGVLVKSGVATRRYLGTVYINSSGGQTEDTILKRYVWNYYNRVARTLRVMDTTTSWTYTTATVRQMNGSTVNQVNVVIGVAEVPVSLSLRIGAGNTNVGVNMWAGIGQSASTAPSALSQSSYATSDVAHHVETLGAGLTVMPAVGFSWYTMLEWSAATGTTTFYGNDTATTPMRSGMSGWVEG